MSAGIDEEPCDKISGAAVDTIGSLASRFASWDGVWFPCKSMVDDI